jgi:hypothetical protein
MHTLVRDSWSSIWWCNKAVNSGTGPPFIPFSLIEFSLSIELPDFIARLGMPVTQESSPYIIFPDVLDPKVM